jgi:hypothetical protein
MEGNQVTHRRGIARGFLSTFSAESASGPNAVARHHANWYAATAGIKLCRCLQVGLDPLSDSARAAYDGVTQLRDT